MSLKTPCYVIHKDELDNNFNKLVNALENNWPNYIIGYSYKTNSLPWVAKHFDGFGCYAEVVSKNEYELARLLGVPKDRVIYNGPIKTEESFLDVLRGGGIVNIDSQREIEWLESLALPNPRVGIRVNFDIENMCPGQSQCPDEGGRFGFCYENGQFEKALLRIREKGIKISGLHLHTSSKTRGLDIYKAIAEMACKLAEEYSLDLNYVDVGGGFFGGLPSKPQFEEYLSLISSILKNTFDPGKTTLVLEPGMAVIGAPVSYITSVLDVKDTGYNRFVVTDGSRTSIDPLMTKSAYFCSFERQRELPNIPSQIICGSTCMEHDRLFTARNMPELSVGDRIIYNKVGAYSMCLTPLFISYFPDVYVESDGELSLVRAAWGAEEYIQKSVF